MKFGKKKSLDGMKHKTLGFQCLTVKLICGGDLGQWSESNKVNCKENFYSS